MKMQLLNCALSLLLTLCVCETAGAQEEKGQLVENLRSVKLIDASTGRSIVNASVEVRSNNGVFCKKAPCPRNDQIWKGASNAKGVLRIPSYVIQQSTKVKVARYLAINFKEARAAKSLVELWLDVWHIQFTVRRPTGSSVWLISRGDIAAGDETNRNDLWRAFPCRAKLSAKNLRRMEAVLAAVKPSGWDMVYGAHGSDIYSRDLTLERADEAAGGESSYRVTLYRDETELPKDLQVMLAAVQAAIKQSFTKQSCGLFAAH